MRDRDQHFGVADRSQVPRVRVTRWEDPLVDRLGHDPRSSYAEHFWLPIVGPTSLWMLRHLAGRLDRSPEGFDLDLVETARRIGLGSRTGRQSPLQRSLQRLSVFGLLRVCSGGDGGLLEARRFVPPVLNRQLERLWPGAVTEHRAWNDLIERGGDPENGRLALARHIARALVESGDPYDNVEAVLLSCRMHPAVAAEATRWACGKRERPRLVSMPHTDR